MEIGERILEIRTDAGMSRSAFGEALGVSGDVVNNLERNRLKNLDQKEPLFRLLCERFNVDYVWLTTGEGEMHTPEPTDKLDALFGEYGCDDFDRSLIKEYLALNPEQRNVLKEYVSKVFQGGQTAEKEKADS